MTEIKIKNYTGLDTSDMLYYLKAFIDNRETIDCFSYGKYDIAVKRTAEREYEVRVKE